MMKGVPWHVKLGLVSCLAALLFGLLPPAELAELKGYDLLHFSRRGIPSGTGEIVIVAIDEPSFAEMGRQWPWPRSLHARLIHSLSKAGASVIGFDVLFAEPSDPVEDQAFSDAMRSAGRVVLASDISSDENEAFAREMMVEPIPALRDASATGVVSVPLDRDNVVRRFFPLKEGEVFFSQQIARLHTGRSERVPENACISYALPPGGFRTVSYYQALEPERYLPRDVFKGKIVLVGTSIKAATGATSDYFATPYLLVDDNLMSGVEIQANMVYDFLTGEFVTRPSWAAKLALLILLAQVGSLVQIRWRPVLGALLSAAGFTAYLIVSRISFNYYRVWLPTFTPLLLFLIPYVVCGIDSYITNEKKKREIRRIFSHYLSPAVLESVLEAPGELALGGKKVEATILFSDIAGFTTMSETMLPEEISNLMNVYLTEMAGIIFAQNGTIDKFIGDAVMAFWGAPLPDRNHALHACRAALSMQDRLVTLREQLMAKGYPRIEVRIGINTGEVIAGNMGSSELYNYTVLGDAVNIAARLEGANKDFGSSILISDSVYQEAAQWISARPLGRILVKGKKKEVGVYELLGCHDNEHRA